MEKIRVGFVPSFRNRYSAWCAQMRAESLATLASVPHTIVFAPSASPDGARLDAERGYTPTGAVHSLDEAEVVARYFALQEVDCLVLCPLDFGDERSAAKIAEKLGVPVLLYATKEPPTPEGPSLARASDSYCGNLSMASALYRRKLPFHYAGIFFPTEEAFAQEVETFVRAVAVVKGLTNARIGQVGVRPGTFETVGYSEAAVIAKFGQNIIFANLSDIVDRAKALADDDAQVLAVIADTRATMSEITVGEDYLLNAAKVEVALAAFFHENKLSSMAVQCWPSIQRLMGVSMCAIYGRLTGQEMLTACETDILGALAMMVNYQAALGETLPHFIDWTIQHRENPNWLLAWHCGNAPAALAADAAQTALRSRGDMKGELPVKGGDAQAGLAQFQIKPGRVTFCRLAEYDGEWKMLIALGDIVPSDETLAGTWSWVAVKDHAHLYRTLVEEGFIHHASMIHGDQSQALLQACKFLGIKPVLVD